MITWEQAQQHSYEILTGRATAVQARAIRKRYKQEWTAALLVAEDRHKADWMAFDATLVWIKEKGWTT